MNGRDYWNRRCRSAALATTGLSLATGCSTLLGWGFGIDAFIRVAPGLAPMKPNTAACFILCGLALLARLASSRQAGKARYRAWHPAPKSVANAAASITALLGAVTLIEYLTGWSPGLDTWMFHDALVNTGLPHDGRMTPVAALNFTLLGLALLFLDYEPRKGFLPAQHAALVVSLTGLIALLGYLYGIASLYNFFAYSSMALHTSITFTLLGLGIMMARPDKGLMSVVTSPHGGGMTARRLLPAAILLPAALGWIRLQGELAGWYGTQFGLALFASSNIITFVILVWLSARRLNRLDTKRRQAHAALILSARDLQEANERLRREVGEHRLTEQARQRTEHQLHQSQRMESLGTLAGGIAHDFNNILTAVYLNADRARKRLSEDHPVHRNLEEISRAGTRAADLVRRIMTFGRQEEPLLKTMNLRQAVEESLQLLCLSLPSKVKLETELAGDTPAVAADSTQIHQILINLGTNAIHAMEERGGVLSVKLERVFVTAILARQLGNLQEGPHVRLIVADTGKGMEKRVLDRIFDPFFTTKGPGIGTGLGLSVVHSIVNLHKGCVTAYSEPGRGTVFHLYFPAAQPVEVKGLPPRPDIPRGNAEHLLCVDDDAVILSGCTEMLEELGYRVSAFTDPRLAREEFRTRPHDFDLLITDLSMPGLSGLELIGEIRMLKPGIPVILSSGYLSAPEAEHARAAGVQAFVQKPDVAGELGEVVADTLALARAPITALPSAIPPVAPVVQPLS